MFGIAPPAQSLWAQYWLVIPSIQLYSLNVNCAERLTKQIKQIYVFYLNYKPGKFVVKKNMCKQYFPKFVHAHVFDMCCHVYMCTCGSVCVNCVVSLLSIIIQLHVLCKKHVFCFAMC